MTEEEYFDIYNLTLTMEDLSYHSEKFEGYKDTLGYREDYKKLIKAKELISEVYKSFNEVIDEYEGKF